jgi:hypothetical protein
VRQWNGYYSWGRDIVNYSIQGALPEVCGDWILWQTLRSAGQ